MTFIRDLRVAARRCDNLLTRSQLSEHADAIDALVSALYLNPTTETMQQLTAEWARAYWTMDLSAPEAPEKHDDHAS